MTTDKYVENIKTGIAGMRTLARMLEERCLEIEQMLPAVSTADSKKTKAEQLKEFQSGEKWLKIKSKMLKNRGNNAAQTTK